ncbi:MAG: hypothetical protein EZS28_014842 [Streblomastix strix]|uniref:Right handed beta helix domain-containing protein n=1 Tax=Streblomastix strix TaxID=222440 RepID=A0A5J4W508_9EUKA|nr:MAG: hypothetical protein EZS28_014842 [Streblomastix strix]
MHKSIILMMLIIVHFIFCVNCHIVHHVNRAYNQGETTEVLKPQRQTAQQKGSQLLTFFSYSNVTFIKNMKFTVYSNTDNENSPNFLTRQKFDSHPLDHVTIQQNSVKYEEVDSITLIQHDNELTFEKAMHVLLRFIEQISIAMRNSSIINFIRIIYVAVPTRAILIAFLPRRIINYKYQSQQQKKNSNKLIIPLLIITCHSIFEVSAVTNYLSNQEFDGKRSQSIIVNQSTDEFKVINCSFRNCWNGASGGALNIRLSNGGKCWILNTTFTNCNTTLDGGAIYANISSGAELTIDGLCLFTDCHAQWSGGGVYARIDGQSSKLLLEDYLKFERCSCIQGGGTSIENSNNGSCNINKVSCIDCGGRNLGGGIYVGSISEEIQKLNGTVLERCHADMGGGLEISLSYGNPSVELISITCIECRASNCGGGLVIAADQGIQVIMHGQCSIQNCSSYYGYYGEDVTQGYCTGGGMECFVLEQCFVEINNASFKNCFAYTEGGGLLAYIQSGGKLIIDQSSFYKCKCNEGNGGGIYTLIDFVTQCKFIIKDTLIQGCKALNNTNSSLRYPESGYGGGIFLTGSGDYDPSTNLIDLRGMKIYNNTADKYGQSLYVAMTKVVEWCKYGILGEYVKGNYSDGISNKNELIGIPVKYDIFNSRTQAQIIEQQKPLECWWMFGILKSAQVVVNVSNPDGKLIFHLEGQRLTPGYLNVKIFELRDKTQEEIDQEQKQIKSNLNNINLNFSKENSPNNSKSYKHQIINNNQIIIGKQKQQQEQSINESSNSIFIPINSFPSSPNDNKLLQTESNEIIYPPKDGSSSPIQIEGEIENEQKASFGMDEYEWLNYKQKLYGVLISNDGEVFTGLNGSVNSAVPLKITIEEEGQQEEEAQELEQDIAPDTKEGYQFPYWGIILIVVSVLIIASIIISIII